MSKGRVLKFDSVKKAKEKAKKAKGKQKAFLLLLIAVVLVLGFMIIRSEVQIHKLQTEKRAEENRNAVLTRTKEDLQAELDSINTSEYIERLARRDLQLIKPNELLFILPEIHKYTSQDVTAEAEEVLTDASTEKAQGEEGTEADKLKQDEQRAEEGTASEQGDNNEVSNAED